jgi:hypothetical protein
VAFSLLLIRAGCSYVLNECSLLTNTIDSDRTRGEIWQTIVKAIRVVVVNKAAVNKEAAARATKAAVAAKVVAKKAANKAATARLTIQYEACDWLN